MAKPQEGLSPDKQKLIDAVNYDSGFEELDEGGTMTDEWRDDMSQIANRLGRDLDADIQKYEAGEYGKK